MHEDLQQLADDAYRLAGQRCVDCGIFHSIWPYIRIARITSGVEGGGAALTAAIGGLCTDGSKDILIVGAADTGVLCLTANAARNCRANFTLIDICDTPLELCRRFASTFGLRLETSIDDVTRLALQKRFDIVIAHSLLQHLPSDRRMDMLSCVAAALKPDGRFLQIFNAGGKIEGAHSKEYRGQYPDWVLSQLDARGVSLPAERDVFRAKVAAYAAQREQREGAIRTPEEVLAMMRSAGFSVMSCEDVDLKLAAPYTDFVAKLSKRRYLSIASISR